MSKTQVTLQLNGKEQAEVVDSGATLLTMLRAHVGLTSPKRGCLQGTCGTCTVLIDGEPRLSCLTVAEICEGQSVDTLEGMKNGADLHPLQQAFMDNFAAQCGFCTPGMLMAAKALLDRNAHPSREDVVDAISGNICRCTGYEPIIRAILSVSGSNIRGVA